MEANMKLRRQSDMNFILDLLSPQDIYKHQNTTEKVNLDISNSNRKYLRRGVTDPLQTGQIAKEETIDDPDALQMN